MNYTLRGNDAGFNVWFGLVPCIPLAAGFGPVFHPVLVLDAIDQVTRFDELASLVEVQIDIVQEHGGFGVFSGLHCLAKSLKRWHVLCESRPAPHVRRTYLQSYEKENAPYPL
jgi:hypothetical protein